MADQHVVVLGGTSGFGFATAKAALAEGARVTIASRSAERVRGALARLGNAASGECVDVTVQPMLERFFAGLGAFGHLAVTVGDPLLNKRIMELTDEEARSAFEVRFWGAAEIMIEPASAAFGAERAAERCKQEIACVSAAAPEVLCSRADRPH